MEYKLWKINSLSSKPTLKSPLTTHLAREQLSWLLVYLQLEPVLVSHSTALSRLDSNMIQTFKSGWRLVWGTNWAPAFIGHQSKSERPDTRWQLQVVVRAGCGWRGARSGAEWRGGGWSPAHGARRSQQSPGSGHSGAAGTWYSDTSWYN